MADMVDMKREKTTLNVDAELLRAARQAAAQSGKRDYEIWEAAMREYLGLAVLDRVWARNSADPLTAEEALALAYSEIKTTRGEKKKRAAS